MKSDIDTIRSKVVQKFREKWPDTEITDDDILQCVNLYFDTFRFLGEHSTFHDIKISNLGSFRIAATQLLIRLRYAILRFKQKGDNQEEIDKYEELLQHSLFFCDNHAFVGSKTSSKRRHKSTHKGQAYWDARCSGLSPVEAQSYLDELFKSRATHRRTVSLETDTDESELC
jgi:hypothetical protein